MDVSSGLMNHAFSSALRDGSQLPYRPFERDLTVHQNLGDDQNMGEIKDFDFSYYEDQDGLHRKRPRRIFNWIHSVIRSNNSDQAVPKATETKFDVRDDKVRLIEIERNLTVTLTHLSRLLTEIHDIMKHNKKSNFKPLHDVIKTTNFNNDRYKRQTNATENGKTGLINNAFENNNERDTTASYKELEGDKKQNIDKVIFKKDLKATKEDKSVPSKTNKEKRNEKLNATKAKVFKKTIRRNCGKYIFKRHANGQSESVTNKTENKSTERDNTTNVKALEKNGTLNLETDRHKRDVNETVDNKSESLNDTKLENKTGNTTNDKELVTDGRRKMPDNPLANTEVKERLLNYINEGFDEIKNKIASLKQTKDMFSNDVNFKIGYIIASLDSLDANMKNLRSDLERNKFIWSDRKILNLYDTVKSSNNAVGSLLDVLKSYIDVTVP